MQCSGEEVEEKHGTHRLTNFWWVLIRTHDGIDGWVNAVRIHTGADNGIIPEVPTAQTMFEVPLIVCP